MLPPLPRHPSLYQINARVWLNRLQGAPPGEGDLAAIPDAELDRLADLGFDLIYLLGVWQTGERGRRVAAGFPGLTQEYRKALPDFSDKDVCGSPFALAGYTVHRNLGGDAALVSLRDRLHRRGLRLILDFVPNHTGLDHPWIGEHPDYYIRGTRENRARDPENWWSTHVDGEELILAHGRDPYYAGWTDTLQLDYGNPELQSAMVDQLLRAAELCDGLRCDMAMLILPQVFQRTWGIEADNFWPRAIGEARARREFLFIAEAYWDLEWTMLRQGFDYAYDKRLYDRLSRGPAQAVRQHLQAGVEFQSGLVRFLENHDEPRAATVFPGAQHGAAAALAYLSPGLRFFHNQQEEGYRRRVPVQLCRGPQEPTDPAAATLYEELFDLLRDPLFKQGEWELLPADPAGPDVIAFRWSAPGDAQHKDRERLAVVNYSAQPARFHGGLDGQESLELDLGPWDVRILENREL